jgi:class 3 adenylate cyclase
MGARLAAGCAMPNALDSGFQNRFIRRLLLLPMLDLGVTTIFIFVTRRFDVVSIALGNLALFALAACAFAWLAFRPVATFVASGQGAAQATRRIESLPAWSACAAAALVVVFSITASSLGVYTPARADLSQFSQRQVAFALLFYAAVYAALYGYFTYFAVNDLCIEMRRHWRSTLHFSSGLAVDGAWRSGQLWHGGLARRLAAIFLVIGVLPALLLGMDLTLLAPIRSVQGLSVDNVIALDLIASLYVVFASVYFVSRSLLAPARELFEAHEAVRGGNLQYTAAVLTNDELGEVTARFNTMVAALRERAMMKDALQRYLSPGVATELIASGGMIPSRLVEATVMFTDIEAFTTLSETLTPQETVDTLNAYFSVLTAVIHREGGTVNNFVGDAVVAVFNVPLPQADHAHAAVRAALAIQRQLAVQRFSLADGRHVALPTRIGVHTGPVCAGSIGGSDRQGYTVYGDVVNLAARIEQLNKRFQTRILVSDATRALVVAQGCAEHFSPLPRTTVMGRQEPVEVFSLGPAA